MKRGRDLQQTHGRAGNRRRTESSERAHAHAQREQWAAAQGSDGDRARRADVHRGRQRAGRQQRTWGWQTAATRYATPRGRLWESRVSSDKAVAYISDILWLYDHFEPTLGA